MKVKYLTGSLFFILISVLFLTGAKSARAANSCSSQATGNFASTTTWTACGNTTPQTTDTITINTGNTVTLTGAVTVAGVTINNGGTLADSTFLLTDSGNYTNNGTHSGSGGITVNGASAVIGGTGSVTNTGIFTISGATGPSFSGSASLSFSGAMTMGSGPVTITSGAIVTVVGTTTLSGAVKITNNGTYNANGVGGIIGSASVPIWTQGSNATLNFGGSGSNFMSAGGTLNATSTGNTVNYNVGSQTCKDTQYYNLSFGGTGTATKTCTSFTSPILGNLVVAGTASWSTAATTTVNGAVTISGGTLVTGNFGFTASTTTEVSSGTLSLNGTASKTLIGIITVDGASAVLNGSSAGINIQGGLTQSAGSVAITGTATFGGGAHTIAGTVSVTTAVIASTTAVSSTASVTLTALTVSSGVTLNNSGTLLSASTAAGGWTITGALVNTGTVDLSGSTTNAVLGGGGTFTNAANATFDYAAALPTITTFTATATGNTVNYDRAGAQTCYNTQYYNLTFSGTTAKTCTSVNATILGSMIVSGGASWAVGATSTIDGNLTLAGGSITTGAFAFTVIGTTEVQNPSTLALNSAGTKTLDGLITVDGGTLNGNSTVIVIGGGINQTSGSVAITGSATFGVAPQTLSGVISVATAVIASTTSVSSTAVVTLTTLTVSSGITLNNSGTVSSTVTTASGWTITGTFTNTGTVNLSGSTTNVVLAGAGHFTNAAGATLFIQSGSPSVTTFSASATGNTVNYAGAGQTCLGTQYYNLTFSGSGTKICSNFTSPLPGTLIIGGTASLTLGETVTVDGILTVSGGTLTTTSTAFTAASTTEISAGTLTMPTGAGNKTFTGLITLDGGTLSGASANVATNGGILNNAGTVTLTGTDTITAASTTFDGNNTIGLGAVTVTSPGTVINNGTITMSGLLSGNSLWQQGVGGILDLGLGGTTVISISTFDATTVQPNTVDYNGATAQTCLATQYDNLTLEGAGIKTCLLSSSVIGNLTYNNTSTWTLSAALTVNGNLTITTGTIDVSSNNYPVNLNGNLTNSGIFNTESDTVTLQGTTQQIVSGTFTGASDFSSLTITNSSGHIASDCELTSFNPGVAFMSSLSVANTYTVTTGGVNVQYNNGATYTFANTDWVGSPSAPIYFRGSVAGSGTWLLDVTGSQTSLAYINVSRSDASGGTGISALSITNRDCGNNTNWNFGASSTSPTLYSQTAYGWYANQNSTQVGPQLAATNTTTTLTAAGEAFRLRMLLAVDATSSLSGVDSFALQFANKGNGASCSSTQFSYTTITGSTAVAYNTNSGATDGSALTSTSTDPTDGGRPIVEETYQSAGIFTAATTIPPGSDGNWDFSLIDNGATPGGDYCFQAVFSSSTSIYAYSIYPEIIMKASPFPVVSNILLNGGSDITLLPDTTQSVTVVASTTDPGGPGNILYATSTIYRTSLGNNCTANNTNCYQVPSSSCVFTGSTSTVTCSASVWYFAQSTGNASSSFPSDSWTGAITITDGTNGTALATSTTRNVNVLTAVNITTVSINYGTLNASSTSNATNQTTTVQNAGNSSTTIQVSGTAFVKGVNTIATSSQHYATSSFTFGGTEQALSDVATTISGFTLTAPTSSVAVQGNVFWGIQVPAGNPTGTYTATTTFTPIFSP